MVEREDDARLTEILKAASDPTRRAILTILVQEGPARVTDLAGRFAISLNAVSKHIKALEKAGLVTRRTDWREHLIAPEMEPLRLIDDWFGRLRSTWDARLDRLGDLMTETAGADPLAAPAPKDAMGPDGPASPSDADPATDPELDPEGTPR